MSPTLLCLIAQAKSAAAGAASGFDTPRISGEAAENTYAIASWIMQLVEYVLRWIGLDRNEDVVIWVYAILVFLIAVGVGFVAKWLIIGVVRAVGRRSSNQMYCLLIRRRFFTRLCRIVPPFVFLLLIQFTLYMHTALANTLTRLTWIYVAYVTAAALNVFINVLWERINLAHNTKKLPLKGLVQLVKGIVWIITGIICLAIIFDKSPASLLAGLGAFAAVLMLIFKDSILGLVAGVQLSENDSLHEGDWIKVNGTDANGTVKEVTLTTVKVENWDKTITCLPPYQLVSGSFTNYRNMQQSNTRRIQRSYMIDADSVIETTPDMLAEIGKLPFMAEYIAKKQEQKEAGKVENVNNSAGLVDGTIETNLGLFRAYVKMWLDANENIDRASTCFVSTLPQTSNGIPFQIYCFTNTSAWLPYEAIKDYIFEHISVVMARFHLYTFEAPSGRDTIIDGYLSPGGKIQNVFGVPTPFFQQAGSPGSAQPPKGADVSKEGV